MAAKVKIQYPDNLNVQGLLSYPIKSENEIVQLKEWRESKKMKKPKFPDKVGVNLLLKPAQYDKVVEHLEKVYVPFIDTLYKETDGDKGLEPEIVKGLLEKVKTRNWSDADLPIRDLTEKDIENNGGEDSPFVAKISIKGPFEADFKVKALVRDSQDRLQVVELNELEDHGFDLPDNHRDEKKLWWGSSWNFRTSIRFNAFESARGEGVTAYGQTLYLLPHLGLPIFGGNSDAAVIMDEGDWEED